jgi:hypothetical protein
VEFGRIKKPSRAALITGQLLYHFITGLRQLFAGNSSSALTEDQMIEWSAVHDLVCTNVSRFFSELISFKTRLQSLTSSERKALS